MALVILLVTALVMVVVIQAALLTMELVKAPAIDVTIVSLAIQGAIQSVMTDVTIVRVVTMFVMTDVMIVSLVIQVVILLVTKDVIIVRQAITLVRDIPAQIVTALVMLGMRPHKKLLAGTLPQKAIRELS